MRAEYIEKRYFNLLLTALMPENRLALEIAESTGLRISDVLSLRTAKIKRMLKNGTNRVTVREQKTGKNRQVYLKNDYLERLLRFSDDFYCFPHRLRYKEHRTRQAVWKDLKRVSRLYRIEGSKIKQNVAPHSARKLYAVELRQKGKTAEQIREIMKHSSTEVTFLYCMADILQEKDLKEKKNNAIMKKI